MITPQVFALCLFLTATWGGYLVFTMTDYRRARKIEYQREGESSLDRRKELVKAFRRMVVAFSVWMLPVSFLLRTGLVLMGFGDQFAGQVLFFSLAGTNVVSSIFVLVSLKLD